MSAISLLLLIVAVVAERIEATETCTRKLDILIAVDASSSKCVATEPCPEWNAILQFCKDLVNSLTIGKDDTQVAFVTLTDEAKTEWNLAGYKDKNSLSSAFGRVAYKGGELINLVSAGIFFTEIFNIGFGDRLDVPNLAIAMTDGSKFVDVVAGGALLKALEKIGVKVVTVCVAPGCTESLARGLVSDPIQANVTYFLLDSYLSIDAIRDNLVKQICSYGQTKLF